MILFFWIIVILVFVSLAVPGFLKMLFVLFGITIGLFILWRLLRLCFRRKSHEWEDPFVQDSDRQAAEEMDEAIKAWERKWGRSWYETMYGQHEENGDELD